MVRSTAARQLTARDQAILQWIGVGGIASFYQLWSRFWAGKSEKTATARLRQLTKAGFIEIHACDVRSPGEKVFTLTRRGYLQVSTGQRDALLVGLPTPSEIKQQLLAQDAYLAIEAQVHAEGGKVLNWQSENVRCGLGCCSYSTAQNVLSRPHHR